MFLFFFFVVFGKAADGDKARDDVERRGVVRRSLVLLWGQGWEGWFAFLSIGVSLMARHLFRSEGFLLYGRMSVCVLKFSKAVSVFGFFWSVKRDKLLAKLTRK